MHDNQMLLAVMGMGMAVIGITLAAQKRQQTRSMVRIHAIRDALNHPTLDGAAKSDLVRLLAREELDAQGRRPARRTSIGGLLARLWVAAGWSMFAGGGVMVGLWAMGFAPRLIHDDRVIGMTAVGFVMLTLPLAVHEMRSRLSPASAPR